MNATGVSCTDNQLANKNVMRPVARWGLLGPPVNDCERTLPVPKGKVNGNSLTVPINLRNVPQQQLAVVCGEITIPVDSNVGLPAAHTPWMTQKWKEFYSQSIPGCYYQQATDLKSFPSMLAYSFQGNRKNVCSLRMSEGCDCGRWIVTGRNDGALEVWDVPALKDPSPARRDLAHDGMAGLEDDDIEQFGASSLGGTSVENAVENQTTLTTPQLMLGLSTPVTALAFVPPTLPDIPSQARRILAASAAGEVRLFASPDKPLCVSKWDVAPGAVWSLDSVPMGNFFFSGTADRSASLWCFDRRHALRLFKGHTSDVEAVRSWPNSVLLATGSADSSARLWDVRTAAAVAEYRSGGSTAVTQVAPSPNGSLLAEASDDGIRVWDVTAGKLLRDISYGTQITPTFLKFARGSRFLVCGQSSGNICIIDVENDDIRFFPLANHMASDGIFTYDNMLMITTVPITKGPDTSL